MRITDEMRNIIRDLYLQFGEVAAEKIVEVASDPASPLHGLFDWNDATAAHAYRLDQARSIMRRVMIISVQVPPTQLDITVTDSAPTVRTSFVVPDPRPGHGGYVTIADVAATPTLREQMLSQYGKEMTALLGRLKKFQDTLASQGAVGDDVTAFNTAITTFGQAIAAMPQPPAQEAEAAD